MRWTLSLRPLLITSLSAVLIFLGMSSLAMSQAGAIISYGVTALVATPTGLQVQGTAVDEATDMIYVSDTTHNLVTVIDGATNLVVATISLGALGNSINGDLFINDIAVNQRTDTIYVSDPSNNTVHAISGVTNHVIATIPVGQEPEGIGVNEFTNTIYVGNYTSSSVSIIDGATESVTSTFTEYGFGLPTAIAVNPDTNHVYVAGDAGNILDINANALTGNIIFTDSSQNIAVDPATNTVFIASAIGVKDQFQIYNATTNTLSYQDIPTSFSTNETEGMAFDPTTDTLYLGEENSPVVIFDVANSLVSEIASYSPTDPVGLGVDAATGAVYVSDLGGSKETVLSSQTQPGAPTVTSTTTANQSVSVAWTPPSGTVLGYVVEVSSPDHTTQSVSVNSTAQTATVTGLTNGTPYFISVVARGPSGPGQPTSYSQATPEPILPSAPTITAHTQTSSTIAFTWTAAQPGDASIGNYQVSVTPSGGQATNYVVPSSATSDTVTGLSANTSYAITVTAVAADGIGQPSAALATTTAQASPSAIHVPSAPLGVSAKASGSKMTVSWRAPISNGGASIARYTVTLSPGGKRCVTSALSCTIPGLSPSKRYIVSVVASNRAGTGPAATVRNLKG